MRRRADRAFTLLEVVLAVTLVTGLLGAAFGFYLHTAKVRERVAEDVELARMTRVVMDRMTAELQNARVPSRALRMTMVMDDSLIEFVTTTVPTAQAWVEPTALEDPPTPECDVHVVSYTVGVRTNDDGEQVIDGLERGCVKALTADVLDVDVEGGDLQRDLLAEQIKFFRVRYYMGLKMVGSNEGAAAGVTNNGWVENWSRRVLPEAVEITLGTQPRPDEMDVEEYLDTYETYRRVVYLPGSKNR